MVILGNKKDIETKRQVEKEFALNWAQREKGELLFVSDDDIVCCKHFRNF